MLFRSSGIESDDKCLTPRDRFIVSSNTRYPGAGRTLPDFAEKGLDSGNRPFHFQFHASVTHVPDPADQPTRAGRALTVPAETDPLNSPGNTRMTAYALVSGMGHGNSPSPDIASSDRQRLDRDPPGGR